MNKNLVTILTMFLIFSFRGGAMAVETLELNSVMMKKHYCPN